MFYNIGACSVTVYSFTGSQILVGNHTGNFYPAKLASVDRLVLVAAGTGFTPMASVIQYFHFRAVRNPGKGIDTKKEVVLLFFNKTAQDIIWKEQLDRIERETSGSDNFTVRVHHILSQDPDWPGHQGQIRAELLKEILVFNVIKLLSLSC